MKQWISRLKIPKYLRLARIIPLSKEESNPYPSHGQVRTIAVTPATMKLLELCILQKVRAEIDEKGLLHPLQRGFVPNRSCDDNLIDLTECINKAKDIEQKYREIKVLNRDRTKTFVLFIDLKKAFDKVPRRKLIRKLELMGMDRSLT